MHKREDGFGALHMLLLCLVIVLVSGIAVYVVRHNGIRFDQKQEASNKTTPNNESTETVNPQENEDPYEDWETYNNTDYGFSFRYPSNWAPKEISYENETDSATGLLFAVLLDPGNGSPEVEVLNQSPTEATKFYDDYLKGYKNLTKESKTVKGRDAIVYTYSDTGGEGASIYLITHKGGSIVVDRVYSDTSTDENKYVEYTKGVFDTLALD